MTAIVTIRPLPGGARTVEAGREMGLNVIPQPLFEVEPVPWQASDPARFDAVLFGSANAIQHGGSALEDLTGLPALCVGDATGSAARKAGFAVAATGSGGLRSLLPRAQELGFTRLLRLAGEANVPLDPPPNVTAETCIVYRVISRPIMPELAELLEGGAVVLLHSGEAASHFAGEIGRLGISRAAIALACMAPRIAESAGTNWRAVSVAASVDDRALLALAAQMCQA